MGPRSNREVQFKLGNQTFYLTSFRYHDPSENHLNVTTYPMEDHFVNLSTSGAETVLTAFLQLDPYNAALDPVLNAALCHVDHGQ